MTSEPVALGLLRSIEDAELELMLSWRNEPFVRKNMYTTHEIGMDEHLRWWQKISQSSEHKYFMYEYQGQPLGIVGFNEIDSLSKNASWAFYASPCAPRGTGSRMEYLALNYAFDKLGLHKLHGEVLAFNDRVVKLHQKFGFKIEGVLREQHWNDGAFVDVLRIGLLAREWSTHRNVMLNKLKAVLEVRE